MSWSSGNILRLYSSSVMYETRLACVGRQLIREKAKGIGRGCGLDGIEDGLV
jgi:hypothetical protein